MAAKRSLLRIVLIGVGTVLGIPLILLAAWPDLREEALSLTACYQLGAYSTPIRPLIPRSFGH